MTEALGRAYYVKDVRRRSTKAKLYVVDPPYLGFGHLVVSSLKAEVNVEDEHRRYHYWETVVMGSNMAGEPLGKMLADWDGESHEAALNEIGYTIANSAPGVVADETTGGH